MNFSPISQSMAENKCGRLNVKRSKFNKRSLSAPSFTLEISQRIHYDEFSSEQRFSSFQFYAPSSRINWICQSSPSPRFVPQFSPSFFSSKSTERIDLLERRRPKDRRELASTMGIEKWLLVSIRLARYSILNLAARTCRQKVAA